MKIEEMKKLLNNFVKSKTIDSDTINQIIKASELALVYIEELELDKEHLEEKIQDIEQDIQDNYKRIPYEEMI